MNLMLMFAAHDMGLRSADGRYWAWPTPPLSTRLLEDAYAAIVRQDFCENPNSLACDDLWGGCLGLMSEWCVFYRVYNGDRDLLGRPERAIYLLAFADRKEATRCDCSDLLDQSVFSEWARQQPLKGCPAVPGDAGRLSVELPPRALAPSLRRESLTKAEITATFDSFSGAWHSACQWTSDAPFLATVRRQSGRIRSELKRLEPLGTVPPCPVPSKTHRSPPELKRPEIHRLSKPYSISLAGKLFALVLGSLLLGIGIGWTLRSILPPKGAAEQSKMRHWVQTYQSEETGRLIPREALIEKLQSREWRPLTNEQRSPTAEIHPRPMDDDEQGQ